MQRCPKPAWKIVGATLAARHCWRSGRRGRCRRVGITVPHPVLDVGCSEFWYPYRQLRCPPLPEEEEAAKRQVREESKKQFEMRAASDLLRLRRWARAAISIRNRATGSAFPT